MSQKHTFVLIPSGKIPTESNRYEIHGVTVTMDVNCKILARNKASVKLDIINPRILATRTEGAQ